jgi:hypothetical protein
MATVSQPATQLHQLPPSQQQLAPPQHQHQQQQQQQQIQQPQPTSSLLQMLQPLPQSSQPLVSMMPIQSLHSKCNTMLVLLRLLLLSSEIRFFSAVSVADAVVALDPGAFPTQQGRNKQPHKHHSLPGSPSAAEQTTVCGFNSRCFSDTQTHVHRATSFEPYPGLTQLF